MSAIVISGTGLFTPPNAISNDELVAAFNAYVKKFNRENASGIEAGRIQPLSESSTEFVTKASGIKSRFVMEKEGILNPDIMCPQIPERPNSEVSVLAEIGIAAAKQALEQAGRKAEEIDCVIVACSNLQRAYPAIAIEIQNALGCRGFGFDMNVACSSATFGMQAAADMIRAGNATRALVINPEICSGHLNFRDRDSHFIFGDVATAIVLERKESAKDRFAWEILGTRLVTQFSNNIRNNFGFLNRADASGIGKPDKLFVQEGRKVFKEVVPMVAELIVSHLSDEKIEASDISRLWLHQANINMNDFISRKVLGRDAKPEEAPVILDTYANTSSAGSIIAFHKYSADLKPGATGVICSFGAGYSAGSVIVRKT